MSRAAFDVNVFWMYTVLLHIAGSIVFSLMGMLSLGSMLCLTALWGFFLHTSDKSRRTMGIALCGWLVTGGLLLVMPVSYGSSLLMNLLMLVFVHAVCQQRQMTLWEYSGFRRIPARQWVLLLVLTIAFLWIASYINAISMLFVQNRTAASLEGAGQYLLQSVLVFAVFPAVAEEILFRGYIFRSIENKNMAVILSALMFALLHMNFNQMSYAFVMGLLFAVMVRETGNLSVSVVIHLLFNSYNIFVAAFPDSAVFRTLQEIQIAGYRPLAPSFQSASGGCDWRMLAVGSVVTCFVVLLTVFLLYLLKKTEREKEEREKGLPWKPDQSFWGGCLVCLVVAVSYELVG